MRSKYESYAEYAPKKAAGILPIEQTESHIVSLSQEVARLQRKIDVLSEQVDTNTKDSLRHGGDIARLTYSVEDTKTLKDDVEMLIDDIVTLDERTQSLTDNGLETLAVEIVNVIGRQLDARNKRRGERDV